MFSSGYSVRTVTNNGQTDSELSRVKFYHKVGLKLVQTPKKLCTLAQKEIFSQFLLQFDHDSSQHDGPGKALQPGLHALKLPRVLQSGKRINLEQFHCRELSETSLVLS